MGVGRSSSSSSVPSSSITTLDFSRNSNASKLEMARLLAILCLAGVALAQDSIYSTEAVEPGQYVHNPEWDLTPYQLWKRKQAAKKGLQQPSTNSLPEPARKVVTVRKQKPRVQQAAAAPQQSRFQNFQQVEQQRSSPVYQQQQQQPRREQAYYQPAPRQPVQPAYQQPAFKQQTFQQPQQPQRAAYQQQQQAYQQPQQVAAYPRAQHQTYTPEYIFEANNNAQRIYAYTADKYQAKAEGESYSYAAIY